MLIRLVAFTFLFSLSFNLYCQVEDFSNTSFLKADSIAQLYPDHPLTDFPLLAEKLTRDLHSEVEKFRAIYTWTCLNIENDYVLYAKNKNKRESTKDPEKLKAWNKKFNAVAFELLLKKHRTVCTGYAYIIRELALHAGLSCEIIDGYGRTSQANIGGPGYINHSWNAVQLNGKWYLCDATWSSGGIDGQRKTFIKNYDDCYFLLDPALFIRNHYPADTTWTLVKDKLSLQEFLNRPLVYKDIFNYKVDRLLPEEFNITARKGEPFSFRFSKKGIKPIEKLALSITGPNGASSVSVTGRQDDNGVFSFSHTFTARGKYVVHTLFDGKFVFTYTVMVK